MTRKAATPALDIATVLAEHTAGYGADWEWIRHTTIRLLLGHASRGRGLPAPWPVPPGADVPSLAIDPAAVHVGRTPEFAEWGIEQIAAANELLLEYTLVGGRPVLLPESERKKRGVYYTPPQIVAPMCDLGLGEGLRKADERNPGSGADAALAVLAYDPAVGAGVFLVHAARWITQEYVRRGGDRDDVLHLAMTACCYGVDTDPAAVDMTRTALWWELDGQPSPHFMDRNVILGNVLEGDEPPALTEREAA